MYTVKEIREKSMTPEKLRSAKYDIFGHYIGRPLTYALTIPFLYMGIAPNTVSFISVFPSIIGFFLLGFCNSTSLKVLGWFMFLLWSFLDGVDGNIARYKGISSALGELWDAAAGYIATVLLFFSMGVSSYTSADFAFAVPFIPKYMYIVLGGLTSVFCLLPRLIMHKKALLFSAEIMDEFKSREDFGFAKIIMLNITCTCGFMQVFVLIAVLAKLTNLFVLGYFILNFLITVVSLMNLLRE